MRAWATVERTKVAQRAPSMGRSSPYTPPVVRNLGSSRRRTRLPRMLTWSTLGGVAGCGGGRRRRGSGVSGGGRGGRVACGGRAAGGGRVAGDGRVAGGGRAAGGGR